MSKLKRTLARAAKYSAGGSIGPAPKAHKLVGEFRDPTERAGGIPFLIPYGMHTDNAERAIGSGRRRRDPNERPQGVPAAITSRADGGSVIDDLRESWEMAGADQTGGHGAGNAKELLGVLPVTGNVMSALDVEPSAREALTAWREGKYKRAAGQAALTGLNVAGALSPLPWGRAAGRAAREGADTVNVLVPAMPDGASQVAHSLRERGTPLERIWRDTNRTFAPDGSLRREIPDTGMALKREAKPGDVLPMSHLVRHPRLFTSFPQIGSKPAYITDATDNMGRPVVRTLEGNAGFQINPDAGGGDIRGKLAKLLQYDVNAESDLAKPLRHGTAAFERGIDSARARADMLDPPNRDAVDAYLDSLAAVRETYDMRRDLENFVGGSSATGGRGKSDAADWAGRQNAGNLDARAAEVRATLPEGELGLWPYRRVQGSAQYGASRLPKFEDSYVLPPDDMTGKDLLDFIERWHRFGAGRGRYAAGGRVKGARRRRLVLGGVRGATGGREDALPVHVPAGSYVVPADVVSALGEGNTEAGMKRLEDQFGRRKNSKVSRANGGKVETVPILISDGEFVISPDAVEMAGGSDALDKFVLGVRNAFTEHLKGLPAPNQ